MGREFQDWEPAVGVGRVWALSRGRWVGPTAAGLGRAPHPKLALSSVSLSPKQNETTNRAPGCVCEQH